MTQEQYLLSSHVHLCVTGDHAVLLDLRRDKYIGIPPKQVEALAAAVKGWPRDAAFPPGPAPADASLAKMLADGLLTTNPAEGREARPASLPLVARTLTVADLEARPSPTAGHIFQFLRACIAARYWLKRKPIEAVVARARERKRRRLARNPGMDWEQAHTLVESFLFLRPLLFGARDECLYDSLALVEFLAHHGLYPTWVFGVQTRPFLAHSWVQEGDVVFNDTPEYVRRFTPILTI